jgi:sporulation protein YlmC with PRC-barrel domain
MKAAGPLKLVGEVRDLQIIDSDGVHCGIADDIEFKGKVRETLELSALLVGPGAYQHRLPKWAFGLIARIFGAHVVRIPWSEIAHITGHITLKKPGANYGLLQTERRFEAIVKKVPFA